MKSHSPVGSSFFPCLFPEHSEGRLLCRTIMRIIDSPHLDHPGCRPQHPGELQSGNLNVGSKYKGRVICETPGVSMETMAASEALTGDGTLVLTSDVRFDT